MATSIKLKLMPSKIKGKEGIVCLQLIHNRKVKLLRTRFRLFPGEWNNYREIVIFGNSTIERQIHLQSVKAGLETELKRLNDLINLLEQKGEYTVEELADLYTSNSFNGYFSPFVDYIVRILKEDNRRKTASIFITAKSSFERFRDEQDVLLDKIDNDLMLKYEAWLKKSGVMKNTISCYMRALRSIYNQAVKKGLATQKNPFSNIFTRNDKTIKRAVNEDVIVRIKKMNLTMHKELALARDLFMFSFYLRGISFMDMANLRNHNVKNGYMVHVGDTRLYQYYNNALIKLSHNHSLIGYREEIGNLTEIEAMNHPERNLINRLVGETFHQVDDKDFIEAATFPLLPNSTLLLCSDGLFDMLTSAEILSVMKQSISLRDKVKELIRLANDKGGKDNITVVLIDYTGDEPTKNDESVIR